MIPLHTAAKLALVGLTYIYATRLIDTFCHGIFSPVSVAAIVVGLNILSGVAQLAFFIIFYRQFIPEDRPALMVGAWLAITGSAIALLPKFSVVVPFMCQYLSAGSEATRAWSIRDR